jgi:Tfp pilus assembly protein PilO
MSALAGRLDRTARIVLGAALGAMLLLAVVGWMLLVSPKRSQARDLKTEIANAQTRLAAERSRPRQGAIKLREVHQLELALPDRGEMSKLVRQLDALARRAGVTLDSVTPAAETGGAGYRAIPLTIVVDGKFFRVTRFLASVRTQVRLHERSVRGTGRLLDVQAIDFEQSATPRPNVRATLTMQAYVYGGGSAATGGAAAAAAASATGTAG